MNETLDRLIEAARLLGITQSKKGYGVYTIADGKVEGALYESIDALRQALAQPEQTKCPRCGEVNPAEIHTCSPQVAQEQEPIAWKDKSYGNLHHQNFGNSIPLYTAPPKREWVGLTDDEIDAERWGRLESETFVKGVKWAEAKLKEKNYNVG
jgi:phage FluMu protein Com